VRVGTAAAGIESVELLRLGIPHDGKQIASHSTARRLNQPEHGIGGNGGVDGIAAGLQNIEADLRGKWLTGRDDSVARNDRRTSRRRR
jgi:hypothetical protein